MSDRLLSRRLLDQLAYDYLNTHGFVEAANSLKNESQILSPKPLQQIITTTSEESSTQNRLNKVHKSISNSSSKNSSIKIKNVQKIRNLYLNYKTNLAKTNNNFGHSENNNNNNEESDSPKSVIRQAVLTGDLTKAQKEISRANIQFFDSNNQILFEIRYQELIEAIKNKDLKMALKLSNSNLKHLIDPESTDGILGLMADEKDIKTIKSKSEKDPLEENSQSITTDNLTKTNRLNQVQRALSLMISNNKYNKELLDNSRRLYIWSEINRASLKDITTESIAPGDLQSILDSIFQIGRWSEKKLLECSLNNPDFMRCYSESFNDEKDFVPYDFVRLVTEESDMRLDEAQAN